MGENVGDNNDNMEQNICMYEGCNCFGRKMLINQRILGVYTIYLGYDQLSFLHTKIDSEMMYEIWQLLVIITSSHRNCPQAAEKNEEYADKSC